ncbi:MAG: hypothetical protein ACR2HF_01975 [Methylococcaceae bacterium]
MSICPHCGYEAETIAENKRWYKKDGYFWVSKESRYNYLIDNSRQANVGSLSSKALAGIEGENISFYDVLKHIDFTRKIGQCRTGHDSNSVQDASDPSAE